MCPEKVKWRPVPIMLSADHPPSHSPGAPAQVVNRPNMDDDLLLPAGKPPDVGPELWSQLSLA